MLQSTHQSMLVAGQGSLVSGACFIQTMRHARPTLTLLRAAKSSEPLAAPMTDASVPEGHRGLHSSLYGEGGAEVHGDAVTTATGPYLFREGEDDGSTLLSVASYLDTREGERPVGVFAIYDSRRNLQYVSYSRNIVLAVRAVTTRVPEDMCAFVKVMVFANRAMQSRAALQREADNWMAEAGTVPPGNGLEKDLWEGTEAELVAAMSVDEAAEYEEKKMKMQLAMGEKAKDITEGDATPDERRERMRAAMENSDWSEVIESQTAETQNGRQNQKQIVTPFAKASVHRTVGNEPETTVGAAPVIMDVASVDHVLDEVRPYLIADGGNVDVVTVENGIVALQLQGACGTCPSSSATMKMGIERSLRAAFGDQLLEVIQVGGMGDTSATVESVDMHLNMLRGAIAAYGGGVDVVEVGGGKAVLKFAGPKPIGYGVVAALKDKFPDVTEVVMLDRETGEPIEF